MMKLTVHNSPQKGLEWMDIPPGSLVVCQGIDKLIYKINSTQWCWFNNPDNTGVHTIIPTINRLIALVREVEVTVCTAER